MTWSRGMSRMSGILILSYRLKEVINSYVLYCFWIQRNIHISATRCPIEMGFWSKCNILNGQVIYIEKSKLNIADMLLIPLDRVTYGNLTQCCAEGGIHSFTHSFTEVSNLKASIYWERGSRDLACDWGLYHLYLHLLSPPPLFWQH